MVNRRNASSAVERPRRTRGDDGERNDAPRVSSRSTAAAFVCLVSFAALDSCMGMGGNDGQVERTPAQIYCDPARGVDYADVTLPARVNVIRPGRYGLEIQADDLTAPPQVARTGLLGRLGLTRGMLSTDGIFTAVMSDGAVVMAGYKFGQDGYSLVVGCRPEEADRSTAVPASPFPVVPPARTAPPPASISK